LSEILTDPKLNFWVAVFVIPIGLLFFSIFYRRYEKLPIGFLSEIPLFWAVFDLSGLVAISQQNSLFYESFKENTTGILISLFIFNAILWIIILDIEKRSVLSSDSSAHFTSYGEVTPKNIGYSLIAIVTGIFCLSSHIYILFFDGKGA